MSEFGELKSRVEARVKQLEADLAQAKANAHGTSNDATKAIQTKLSALKDHVGDGWDDLSERWDDLSESVTAKLNDWLK